MALTPKTGTSSAVSLATVGSVPPSLTPDCKVLDWCVAPAGRRSHRGLEISTLKAHRQDLADLTGRSGTPKRPSDESSE